MTANYEFDQSNRKMKTYAWMGSLSLVCLFIGLFMGIMLLAAKATEVFEGIPPTPTRSILLWALFVIFTGTSLMLGLAVFRGVRNIGGKSFPKNDNK